MSTETRHQRAKQIIGNNHNSLPHEVEKGPVGFSQLIEQVHSHLIGTPIPGMAEDLICSISHLFKPDEESPRPGKPNALVRGSLIKRNHFGTPPGYLNISELFQTYKKDRQKGDDETSDRVVDKLSHKPYEADIRFNNRKRSKAVLPALVKGLISQGFLPINSHQGLVLKQGKYSASIVTIPVGDKRHPYNLYQVVFSQQEKEALVLDISQMPNEKVFEKEMRLNWTSGKLELYSTADMTVSKDNALVYPDNSLQNYYRDNGSPWLFSQRYYTNAIGNVLRELSGHCLWHPKWESMEEVYKRLAGPLRDPWHFIKPPDSRELELLKGRNESLISDFLLYFTDNPCLFLMLGYESGLFKSVALGKYLETDEDVSTLVKFMAEEIFPDLRFDHLNYSDLISKDSPLPLISAYYKNLVLGKGRNDWRKSGPMLMSRALNRLVEEKAGSKLQKVNDLNLSGFIDLINPYNFISYLK